MGTQHCRDHILKDLRLIPNFDKYRLPFSKKIQLKRSCVLLNALKNKYVKVVSKSVSDRKSSHRDYSARSPEENICSQGRVVRRGWSEGAISNSDSVLSRREKSFRPLLPPLASWRPSKKRRCAVEAKDKGAASD